MNVELEDEEFAAVDVESAGSEPNKQSSDSPPEFNQSYRVQELSKEGETVASVPAHSSSIARASCCEQLDRPRLEPMPATDWNQRMWPLTME